MLAGSFRFLLAGNGWPPAAQLRQPVSGRTWCRELGEGTWPWWC